MIDPAMKPASVWPDVWRRFFFLQTRSDIWKARAEELEPKRPTLSPIAPRPGFEDRTGPKGWAAQAHEEAGYSRRLTAARKGLVVTDEVDGHTGLLNRRGFSRRFESASASGGPVPLVLIDIAGMREINLLYGADGGDRVIAAVAQRLSSASYEGDTVARVGGREFFLIASCVGQDPDELALFMDELVTAITERPIPIDELQAHVTIHAKARMVRRGDELWL